MNVGTFVPSLCAFCNGITVYICGWRITIWARPTLENLFLPRVKKKTNSSNMFDEHSCFIDCSSFSSLSSSPICSSFPVSFWNSCFQMAMRHAYLYIVSLVVILRNWVCENWVYHFSMETAGLQPTKKRPPKMLSIWCPQQCASNLMLLHKYHISLASGSVT